MPTNIHFPWLSRGVRGDSKTSPDRLPGEWFTTDKLATELINTIQKAIKQNNNYQIGDHRSKYTYLLKWWLKRGGTFYVKVDGIELRAISQPEMPVAVLFIESPFVASVILDWELSNLGFTPRKLQNFRKAIPRPKDFTVIGNSAYLPIDNNFTQPMFDQLLDALAKLKSPDSPPRSPRKSSSPHPSSPRKRPRSAE